MSDIDKLKKENKQLKALLKDAVDLLDKSKALLKRPEKSAKQADKKKKNKKSKK